MLSITWLIPNHYPPWAGFHADAWIALALTIVSPAILLRSKSLVHWPVSAVAIGMLIFVPWLQFAAGLIPFAGQAWITTAYLMGLLMAVLIGQRWAESPTDQLASGLFVAIALASVISVNLQLKTWLGLMDTGIFDLWSMGLNGARPYANFGQPNQLATFLLWGMLACVWGYAIGRIRASITLMLIGFFMVGVALTQSRTAWIGLTFLVAATWVWRRLWSSRLVPWAASLLFLVFWSLPPILKALADTLLMGGESTIYRSLVEGELRPLAWKIFTHAVFERPWFGYGWSEVGHAQLEVATDFPALFGMFGHSHNLFLDLILWLGAPMGILVSGAIVWLFMTYFRAVSSAKDAILVMFLGVIGIHAMLELPLHYAYFLLPTGLVIGILNKRLGIGFSWSTQRWSTSIIWLVSAFLLGGVIRDYLRVEASFQTVRFEFARIGTQPTGKPPNVLLLTQWRERIWLLRLDPVPDMSNDEINRVVQVVTTYPGGGLLYKAAKSLALNGRPEEAREWLRRICKISGPQECELIKRVWAQDGLTYSSIKEIAWPD